MSPALSIVIPTRDTPGLLRSCLASIHTGNPGDGPGAVSMEIVVVDDGGGDEATREIVQEHVTAKLIPRAVSGGFTVAANAGVSATTGQVILLLNSDTEVAPGAIPALFQAFAEDPKLGIVGGDLVYPDGSDQWSGGKEPGLLWLLASSSGLPATLSRGSANYRSWQQARAARNSTVDWVPGAALAMRREVWDQVGPFDESFHLYAQDLDFCLRATEAGWAIRVLPAFRVMHHHGATIHGRILDRSERYDVELLWPDLLAWAQKHRGRTWAWLARFAMLTGITIRSAGRTIAVLTTPRGGRFRRFRQAVRPLRSALRVLLSSR